MTKPATHDPRLDQLSGILDHARAGGLRKLSDAELLDLVRLYRYGASQLSLFETRGRNDAGVKELRALVNRAHSILQQRAHASKQSLFSRVAHFFAAEAPSAIRAEWKLFTATFVLIYGLAIVSYVAVSRDLDLSWSLLDPSAVASEIEQLQSTKAGEPFRGNFTFGVGKSSGAAGMIMANNMQVAILCFATALIPPIYVFITASNGLMLGTYPAVASHWGQAGAILSILVCHGVLEIQAIVLAGAAGLVLVRAIVAPGPWSRRHALRRASTRSWRLLAAAFPMLFVAGLIEGFVTPHVGIAARISVAALSGVALVAWVLLGGRETRARDHVARRASNQAAISGAAPSAGKASSARTPGP